MAPVVVPAPAPEARRYDFLTAVLRAELGTDADRIGPNGLPRWTSGVEWVDLSCVTPDRECLACPPGCDAEPTGVDAVVPSDCPCAVVTPAFRITLQFACEDGRFHSSADNRAAVASQAGQLFSANVGDVLASQLQDGACGGTSLISAATDVSDVDGAVSPAQVYGHLAATKAAVLHIPAVAVGVFLRDRIITFTGGGWMGPAGERVIVSTGYDNVGPAAAAAPAGSAWVYASRAVDYALSPTRELFPDYAGPDSVTDSLDIATNTWRPTWEAYGLVRLAACGVYAALVDITGGDGGGEAPGGGGALMDGSRSLPAGFTFSTSSSSGPDPRVSTLRLVDHPDTDFIEPDESRLVDTPDAPWGYDARNRATAELDERPAIDPNQTSFDFDAAPEEPTTGVVDPADADEPVKTTDDPALKTEPEPEPPWEQEPYEPWESEPMKPEPTAKTAPAGRRKSPAKKRKATARKRKATAKPPAPKPETETDKGTDDGN